MTKPNQLVKSLKNINKSINSSKKEAVQEIIDVEEVREEELTKCIINKPDPIISVQVVLLYITIVCFFLIYFLKDNIRGFLLA